MCGMCVDGCMSWCNADTHVNSVYVNLCVCVCVCVCGGVNVNRCMSMRGLCMRTQ